MENEHLFLSFCDKKCQLHRNISPKGRARGYHTQFANFGMSVNESQTAVSYSLKSESKHWQAFGTCCCFV